MKYEMLHHHYQYFMLKNKYFSFTKTVLPWWFKTWRLLHGNGVPNGGEHTFRLHAIHSQQIQGKNKKKIHKHLSFPKISTFFFSSHACLLYLQSTQSDNNQCVVARRSNTYLWLCSRVFSTDEVQLVVRCQRTTHASTVSSVSNSKPILRSLLVWSTAGNEYFWSKSNEKIWMSP